MRPFNSRLTSALMTSLAAALAYPTIASAQTQNLNIVWDASPSPDVSGYYVYVGTASSNYNILAQAVVPAGQMAYAFQATPGVKYFFAVSAVTASGLESSKSSEVVGGVPTFAQPLNQTGVVGTAIAELSLVASDPDGGTLQYWASGLPPGLTLASTGQFTGTPTTAGSYAVTAAVTDGTSVVSRSFSWTVFPGAVRATHAAGDFDGDGRSDLTVYRSSTGVWYIKQSSNGYTDYRAYQFGISTDVAVPGDYDGDGRADIAFYRPSTGYWNVLWSGSNYTTSSAWQWGISTDLPVQGDYDGDGKTDLAVYRPSSGYWYIRLSSRNYTTYIAQQWGISTDVPATGDYDGDGKTDLGVFRPATGYWYVLLSGANRTTYLAQQWGISTDLVVPSDYDGDGKMDLAVYRPSSGHWYILKSSTNYSTYVDQVWGLSSDSPVLHQAR